MDKENLIRELAAITQDEYALYLADSAMKYLRFYSLGLKRERENRLDLLSEERIIEREVRKEGFGIKAFNVFWGIITTVVIITGLLLMIALFSPPSGISEPGSVIGLLIIVVPLLFFGFIIYLVLAMMKSAASDISDGVIRRKENRIRKETAGEPYFVGTDMMTQVLDKAAPSLKTSRKKLMSRLRNSYRRTHIARKYRNFAAVSGLLDCVREDDITSLKGRDGAYNALMRRVSDGSAAIDTEAAEKAVEEDRNAAKRAAVFEMAEKKLVVFPQARSRVGGTLQRNTVCSRASRKRRERGKNSRPYRRKKAHRAADKRLCRTAYARFRAVRHRTGCKFGSGRANGSRCVGKAAIIAIRLFQRSQKRRKRRIYLN